MYMLHKMSEVRCWSHNDMMDMSKTVFFRYYGYWYQERLAEEEMRAAKSAGMEVRLGARVNAVETMSRGLKIAYSEGGQQKTDLFDAVIFTLSPEHLASVYFQGISFPMDRVQRMKPARIRKGHIRIPHHEFLKLPAQDLQTDTYARWGTLHPHPSVTYFSGPDGLDPMSIEEMFQASFQSTRLPPSYEPNIKTWDGAQHTGKIPHAYTTLPLPGTGFQHARDVHNQFFGSQMPDPFFMYANHVTGLGCYTKDAALAGQWAAVRLMQSMGYSIRSEILEAGPSQFFGIDPRPLGIF